MSEIYSVDKGSIIFNAGDESDCLYYITGDNDAVVGIYENYGTPYERELTRFTVDQVFGEIGAFSKEPRSATAVALTYVELERIGSENIKEYAAEHPYIILEALKASSNNLRRLTRDYADACVTVKDYVETCSAGQPVSPELADRLKKYAKR